MRAKSALILVAMLLCPRFLSGQNSSLQNSIDAYLNPYVETRNFSGVVLVKKQGNTLFERAYGLADRERNVPNTPETQFHIASVSMQYTAVAILRLVDKRALTLDTNVGEFVSGVEGAQSIKVRDLLLQRSGLPDINSFPDYNEVLQHHQTPSSLVKKIEGRPLLFEPGSKFVHEEHSAYNLLALIIERKTGESFSSALGSLVFRPAGLRHSGADDDSAASPSLARGYAPEGLTGLKPAAAIHWSAKTGNASIYTSAEDQARFIEVSVTDRLLSASSRAAVLATEPRVGYGWFRGNSQRLHRTVYYMNGRAPGFASFVLYSPQDQLTVVVLSNIYSSATSTIGNDLAAIVLGLPFEPFQPRQAIPPDELNKSQGVFQFEPDFYQPNAQVSVKASGGELFLHWPSGEISPLIPLRPDHFVDRAYWEDVKMERDATGQPAAISFGTFRGTRSVEAPVNNPH